jgi:hypothetical protein
MDVVVVLVESITDSCSSAPAPTPQPNPGFMCTESTHDPSSPPKAKILTRWRRREYCNSNKHCKPNKLNQKRIQITYDC